MPAVRRVAKSKVKRLGKTRVRIIRARAVCRLS
jgi:hypothetical protein